MGALKELNRDDLLNRFASHTFTETTIEDQTLVEFKDGSSVLVASSQRNLVDDAYKSIRLALVGTPGEVMYTITETQKLAITSPLLATLIFESTNSQVECFNGNAWEVIGGSDWVVRQSTTVQTTDATVTVIDSFTLDDNETYMIQIHTVCTRSDFSDRAGYIKVGTFYRAGGGAVLQGAITTIHSAESDSQYDATLSVNGNLVEATVKGRTGHTVNWKCSMQFIEQ